MLAYIIKSALLLTLLYGIFALLLSRETFHRLNRVALLSVLVASMLLPAVRITMRKPGFMNAVEQAPAMMDLGADASERREQGDSSPAVTLGSVTSYIGADASKRREQSNNSHTVTLGSVTSCLYIMGLLASVAAFLVQLLRLWGETKDGVHTKDAQGNTVVIRGGSFAPYSFLHYIYISASDYEHLRRPILTHEQAHIRLGHTYDLLLLEAVKAVQWFNPFVYLLGRDLKAVHEYEADNAVLSFGIDAKTYQLLLVTKAVGGRLQTVCNNLSHHSLKKRIKMMHKNKSRSWRMGKALILPALMALALVAWAKPKASTAPSPNLSPDEERFPAAGLPSSQAEGMADEAGPVTVAVPGMGLVMTDEVKGFSEKRMLNAFIPKDDAKDFIKKHGPAITVSWLKGTWVVRDDGSFIEEHPVCTYPWMFHTKFYKVMLDGKQLDVHSLPDLPASALRKVEIHYKDGSGTVNLTTKPVQIPADVKGNINPELTILLTGTPPKDSGAKTSIWERRGIFDGFSWKNYTICSWKWDVDDISVHLREVAIRSDHSVRVNVCRGVPQEHIARIKRIMQECGVTNYNIIRQ